jgi:hypothetical protein
MTAKCILHGHSPKLFDGQGDHAGKKFWVCTECNKTSEQPDGRVPPFWVAMCFAKINPGTLPQPDGQFSQFAREE